MVFQPNITIPAANERAFCSGVAKTESQKFGAQKIPVCNHWTVDVKSSCSFDASICEGWISDENSFFFEHTAEVAGVLPANGMAIPPKPIFFHPDAHGFNMDLQDLASLTLRVSTLITRLTSRKVSFRLQTWESRHLRNSSDSVFGMTYARLTTLPPD